MENILNDFFERRNKHIQNNINLVDEKRIIYLKKRQEIKRLISCIIGYLFALVLSNNSLLQMKQALDAQNHRFHREFHYENS